MHSDVLNIHSRLFPSLHSDLEHGKVNFCDFVSIFSPNCQALMIFLNLINKFYSTLKCNHNKLSVKRRMCCNLPSLFPLPRLVHTQHKTMTACLQH
jgi:hypothetical protein